MARFAPFATLTSKFVLVTGIFLIPLTVTSWLLNQQMIDRGVFNSDEVNGSSYLSEVNNILNDLSRSRAALALSGHPDLSKDIGGIAASELPKRIQRYLSALDTIHAGPQRLTGEKLTWDKTKKEVEAALATQDPAAKLIALADASRSVAAFGSAIGDKSNLILDQALDSYYLMDIVLLKVVALGNRLDQVQNIIGAMQEGEVLSPANRVTLIEATGSINEILAAMENGNLRVIEDEIKKKGFTARAQVISAMGTSAVAALREYATLIRKTIVDDVAPVRSTQLKSLDDAYDLALAAIDSLNAKAFPEMQALIQARVDEYRNIRLAGAGAAAAALMIIGLVLTITFRSLRRSTRELRESAKRIIAGTAVQPSGAAATIVFSSQDEIGRTAADLTLINAELVKARTMSVQFQKDAGQLMEVVMSASEGKLSVQLPEVSEGELGVITSALGMMLTSWSGIIADMRSVSATAEQLLASVNEASSEVETSAGVQGERIVHTTSSITALNQDLQQMSSGATHAAEASAKALSQANDGEKVIRQAVTGADNLRTQVQLTAKRVKSMADRSTEIGEILAIINQIASETKLLSINASIEATRAGEEGKSFAVVADSVGDLAEKTQAEAIRIRDMVKAMQADAAESVAAIERQTTAVESEVKLLAEAGSAQELIKNSSTRSSQAVAEIAQTATKQVEVMRQTVAIMHDVSQLAAGTSQASRRSRASVDQLQVQMKTLADKLAQFT